MKKIFLLPFLMLLFITQQSFSQNPAEHKDEIKDEVSAQGIEWAKNLTQRVDEICDLNKDQQKEVLSVNLRFANRMEELKAEKDISADELKSRKEKIMHTILSEYDSILTNEQKSKLKERWDDFYNKG